MVAVPRHVNFVHFADHARTHHLEALLQVRHAPLLHANLNDALEAVLRFDHRRAFGKLVCERLLDIDVLARLAGGNGHPGMLVIR